MKLIVFHFILFFQLLEYSFSENIAKDDSSKDEFLMHIDDARIVGGREALPNQFPYQVALNLLMQNGKIQTCGGVLVTYNWILTAAHCLYMATRAEVILGAHDKTNPYEPGQNRIIVDQNAFIVHSNYPYTWTDIAMIRLPWAVPVSSGIQPISLPCPTDTQRNFVGRTVLVSGWGMVSDIPGTDSAKLKYTYAKIIEPETCLYEYTNKFVPYLSGMLCARDSYGSSACSGDSGGPLVSLTYDGRVEKLIGLVSFGKILRCTKGFPEGFLKVSSYLNWIYENSDGEIGIPQC